MDPGTTTDPGTATGTDPGTATDPGTSTSPPPVDADGDGYNSTTDCDDHNPNVHPSAVEDLDAICNDGVDENCDGVDNCVAVTIVQGTAVVNTSAHSYAGTTQLLDTELNVPSHTFCSYVWPATSSVSHVDCVGCTFAFTLSHSDATSKTGPLCDDWYDATAWATGPQLGRPLSVGYHPAYDLQWDSTSAAVPSLMIRYGDSSTGYDWYGVSDSASFNASDFSWSWVLGLYYAY